MNSLRLINLEYKVLQGCYWMLYCVCYGYMTFYLLAKDYSVAQVGIIAAVFGILSSVIQPVLGRIADKAKKGWKLPLIILCTIIIAISIMLCALRFHLAQGILFGLLISIVGVIMPLINVVCFSCTPSGKGVDFGSARGTGSLGYALISMILGYLLKLLDEKLIPLSAILIAFVILIIIVRMPYSSVDKNDVENQNHNETEHSGFFKFFRSSPEFFVLWIAGLLMMTFHCMTNTYMLQIVQKAGGESDALGITLGIAAVMELPVMFTFGKIYRRFSYKLLFIVTGVSFVAKGLIYFLATNVPLIWGAQFFQMFSFALYANLSVLYATDKVNAEFRTMSQSLMSVTISAGTVAGSLLGGTLIEKYETSGMLLFGGFIAVLGLIVIIVNSLYQSNFRTTRKSDKVCLKK